MFARTVIRSTMWWKNGSAYNLTTGLQPGDPNRATGQESQAGKVKTAPDRATGRKSEPGDKANLCDADGSRNT